MNGISIGVGVSLKFQNAKKLKGAVAPPPYLSAFATGIWKNEGIYRFLDNFSYGISSLSLNKVKAKSKGKNAVKTIKRKQ